MSRLQRFYVGPKFEFKHYIWLHRQQLLRHWLKIMRCSPGNQIILFDGENHDRLYAITETEKDAIHLELITEFKRKLPKSEVYLFWGLLEKTKNDLILQKCTELGVSHFVPILTERSEKTGFDMGRATKIVIEAAEQCGRSDIPKVREPLLLQTALHEYALKIPLLVCEQDNLTKSQKPNYKEVGVFIGPEGGWSEAEKQLFVTQELGKLDLGDLTLRAETAGVAAIGKLLI
jgi:16S rRNA (uracil1498-N3)-methyltransferase